MPCLLEKNTEMHGSVCIFNGQSTLQALLFLPPRGLAWFSQSHCSLWQLPFLPSCCLPGHWPSNEDQGEIVVAMNTHVAMIFPFENIGRGKESFGKPLNGFPQCLKLNQEVFVPLLQLFLYLPFSYTFLYDPGQHFMKLFPNFKFRFFFFPP